ncbi:MAG: bifunctional non-ous end joining protein LigD [Chthoniobacter sp.]|nr:bifunctional non-ous end joining protein LigD [Chthoniobacter sp.]
MESTTLYYRQGSSDKVYQASIEQDHGGYVVNFAYGRRGTTLQTGTKTQSQVNLETARAVPCAGIKTCRGGESCYQRRQLNKATMTVASAIR